MNIKINKNRLELDIIGHCNCKCRYCYRGEETSEYATVEDLHGLEFDKYYVVELIGGEIMLNPNLKSIITYILENSTIGIILTTNLTILPSDEVLFLIKNFSDRITICVSIDSYSKDIHDHNRRFKNSDKSCFETTVYNFKHLSSLGVKLIPHITINRSNVHIIFETFRFFNLSLNSNIISYSIVAKDSSPIFRKIAISQISKFLETKDMTASIAPNDYINKINTTI